MSGVRSYKFISLRFLIWFLKKNRYKGKNNCRFSCTIQEKFVPLQHSCKKTKASINCGIANGKIFVNHGASFS